MPTDMLWIGVAVLLVLLIGYYYTQVYSKGGGGAGGDFEVREHQNCGVFKGGDTNVISTYKYATIDGALKACSQNPECKGVSTFNSGYANSCKGVPTGMKLLPGTTNPVTGASPDPCIPAQDVSLPGKTGPWLLTKTVDNPVIFGEADDQYAARCYVKK